VGKTLYTVGGSIEEFWNITTPPGFKVGDTGERDGADAGLSYDPISRKMFNNNGGLDTSLYEINLATGAATFIGSDDIYTDGLGINAQGVAYAAKWIGTNSLYTIDLGTGNHTLVGGLGVSNVGPQSGLSFDSSGTLWALVESGAIYTLNTSTGAATFVANVVDAAGNTLGGFEGLAIQSVPEPSTMLLLGGGLLGLLAFRRKFRK
jgi:hypothetical protein